MARQFAQAGQGGRRAGRQVKALILGVSRADWDSWQVWWLRLYGLEWSNYKILITNHYVHNYHESLSQSANFTRGTLYKWLFMHVSNLCELIQFGIKKSYANLIYAFSDKYN